MRKRSKPGRKAIPIPPPGCGIGPDELGKTIIETRKKLAGKPRYKP